MHQRLTRWWPAALLGLATIGAYGTAYYAIGVLIPVIADATGWPAGLLAGAFSLGMLEQGALALAFGYVLDRRGSRPVMLPALLVGAALLLLASLAHEGWQFAGAWALGSAAIGGGLYYNVTMPVTARLFPEHRATAFSVLTLVGALASPIFYPLTSWLVELFGWRGALQALVGVTVTCVLPAAISIRAPGASTAFQRTGRRDLITAMRRPAVYLVFVVLALAGIANSALLLYQVSALEAAGLSLAVASGFAGARGAFQIPGRLLLAPLTARFGIPGAIGICGTFAATASLALLIALGAAPVPFALYYAVIGGMSLGLLSPLFGLFQAEVYGDAWLGSLSGVSMVITTVAGSMGAALAGVFVSATGAYAPILIAASLLQLLAVAALLWQQSAGQLLEETPSPVHTARVL